jgi:hypothetical protein
VHIGHIEREIDRIRLVSEAEIARLGGVVHDKDVHIGNIEAALAAARASSDQLAHALAAAQADAVQLRQQVSDKDVHIGNLERAFADVSAELGRVGGELAQATAEAARWQQESERLLQAVHDKDMHIENMTAMTRRLQAQSAMLGHRAARQRKSLTGVAGRPLRALKDLALRAGAPRRVDLIPLAQLARTKQGWRAEGSEPEFLLEPGRAWSGLKGWHTLEVDATMPEACTMRLTFDIGARGEESLELEVPQGAREPSRIHLFVPEDCIAVRLRPCDKPMAFALPRCSLKALSDAPGGSAHADVYERLGGRGGNAGRLVPVSGVAPLDADYAWMATDRDPHFNVSGLKQLRPGWYMVEVLIHSEVNAGAAKFYMDYGTGFSEAATALLPFRSGVVAKRLLRFDPVPTLIRFDPMERKARFSVAKLHFAPVWSWFARDRMLKRLQNHDDEFRGSARADMLRRLKAQSKALAKPLDELLLDRYGATFTSTGEAAMSYGEWIEKIEIPSLPDAVALKYMLQDIEPKPKISVVVPTYNPAVGHLRACLESVLAQSYEHWELCIADDASTQPHVREILREYTARDARIKVCYRTENGHISRASNSALELATGEFVALLDHDDKLAEHALLFMADAIHRNPGVQVLYSDEDKLDENGDRVDPHFKSGWNPDLFYAQNYVSHLGVYRRSLLQKIGGFRPGVEGSQDQDLLLRCLPHLKDTDVVHGRGLHRAEPGAEKLYDPGRHPRAARSLHQRRGGRHRHRARSAAQHVPLALAAALAGAPGEPDHPDAGPARAHRGGRAQHPAEDDLSQLRDPAGRQRQRRGGDPRVLREDPAGGRAGARAALRPPLQLFGDQQLRGAACARRHHRTGEQRRRGREPGLADRDGQPRLQAGDRLRRREALLHQRHHPAWRGDPGPRRRGGAQPQDRAAAQRGLLRPPQARAEPVGGHGRVPHRAARRVPPGRRPRRGEPGDRVQRRRFLPARAGGRLSQPLDAVRGALSPRIDQPRPGGHPRESGALPG